jgi:hypothetical protein
LSLIKGAHFAAKIYPRKNTFDIVELLPRAFSLNHAYSIYKGSSSSNLGSPEFSSVAISRKLIPFTFIARNEK